MGYTKHHAIIVSSWDYETLNKAHEQALLIFDGNVTNCQESAGNPLMSFLIVPDNYSEYWEESEIWDNKRFEFKCWLANNCYIDGSSMLKVVEVSYSDDKGEPQIVACSD